MSFLLAPEVSGTVERDLAGNAASDLWSAEGVLEKPEARLVGAPCQTKRAQRAPFGHFLRSFGQQSLTHALSLHENDGLL